MNFAATINHTANATHSQKNALTDGRITCLYQEIPSLLNTIDQYLLSKGISREHCLALECINSVPGALTLLYLLQNGYRFMLLPPSRNKEKGTDLKPLPHMCRHRLILSAATNEYAEDRWHIENFLEVEKNEQYQAEQNGVDQFREALYLRTSGSMGASKIVVYSHGRLLGNALNCVQRFHLVATDRVAIAVPIFHMYGLGAGFLPAVMAGASIDLQENTHLLKYLERERQFGPNVAFLTPALCDMLLQRRAASRTYKLAVSAGARLKEEIIRAFDDCFGPLVNLYGSTELGAVSAAAPDDTLEVRATTIGQPMLGVTMEVRGTESIEEAEWRIGELYCQHPWGFEAYIEEDSGEIRQADTWFKTGDLAKIYSNGYIQILGRADNSLNRDGYLILLADIEKAIEKIEGIIQVVALTTPAEGKRGQHLVAFYVLGQGANLDSSQIRARCFDLLPRYAIPDEVFVLEALPTLPSGKVDRQALIASIGVIYG